MRCEWEGVRALVGSVFLVIQQEVQPPGFSSSLTISYPSLQATVRLNCSVVTAATLQDKVGAVGSRRGGAIGVDMTWC